MEHEADAEQAAALREAKKRRAEILIDEARKRSERSPTDLQLRFELGQHLLDAGQSGKPFQSCTGRGKTRTRV